MNTRIMVTGVPAVGKTSVVHHGSVPDSIKGITFGKLMYEVGKELHLVHKPDEIETLDPVKRAMLQNEVVARVEKEADVMPVMIDGHLVVETNSGFVAGLPFESVSALGLRAIILLTADPGQILARRNDYPSRYGLLRNIPDRVMLHQRVLHEASIVYALHSHTVFEVVENPDGKLIDTVKSLLLLVKKYLL